MSDFEGMDELVLGSEKAICAWHSELPIPAELAFSSETPIGNLQHPTGRRLHSRSQLSRSIVHAQLYQFVIHISPRCSESHWPMITFARL
jgi:hypothetical protein